MITEKPLLTVTRSAALLMVSFLLTGPARLEASVINAASGSLTDISNAVATASPGDTVMVPAGTNVWTATLNLSGVNLQGAGTNATVFIDEVPRVNNGQPLIYIAATSGSFTEISQFNIRAGVTNTAYNYHGTIVVGGDAPASWRIDHLQFDAPYAKAIIVYGMPYAVIDHCLFTMRAEGVIGYGDGYGDASYATPPNYGGTNQLYIEDCTFTNIVGTPAAVYDGYAGARVVFRHNLVLNDVFVNHGTESSQRYRSTRTVEVYGNTFIDNNNYDWPTMLRGGTGVIFSNTATGYRNFGGLYNYRSTDSFSPWGGVTGFNPWDHNDATQCLAGVHSGPNNSTTLVVSNAGWTANQWVGYTVNDTNTGRFCLISGNTSDTLFMVGPKDLAPITFATGDGFTIYHCYPALDQVGVGSGDYLYGDGPPWGTLVNAATGGSTWPHQVSEPVYIWGNTLNGNPANVGSTYPNIQENRDFFNNTSKPNYTPLFYPHPLTLGGTLTNGAPVTFAAPTNSIPPVITPPPPLAPPSGLSVFKQ